jgi:general stress protein 26
MRFESQAVERVLEVAKDIAMKSPCCWVVTADQHGGASARVVQPFFSLLDQDGWVVRFLTSGKSRKAAEIASSARVCLGYQCDPEQAYVTLAGAARIIDDRAYLHDQWRLDWNVFFPGGPSDTDAVIVEVRVKRIEVWNLMRKIAAPPNGLRAATLQQAVSGAWQSLDA